MPKPRLHSKVLPRNPQSLTARFATRRLVNQILNLIFPDGSKNCLLCHRLLPGEEVGSEVKSESETNAANTIQGVCPFCLQDAAALYHQESSIRLMRVGGHALPVIAASVYDGLVRTAIRQWKYDGTLEFTKWFAIWIAAAYSRVTQTGESPNEVSPFSALPAPDMLVPVPSSVDRFRKRGYDHVFLLAHTLSKELQIPVRSVLVRDASPEQSGFTQSQTAKNARERLQGLQGVYRPQPGVNLTGKTVLLLDDIVTTGATLYTCTQALYRAGAKQVLGAVIAEVK